MADDLKALVGIAVASRVPAGVIGIGTGTTVEAALEPLAARVRAGLEIKAVPTSTATRLKCWQAGIAVLDLLSPLPLQFAFDGVDFADLQSGVLIKGGGAAMLLEKVVARKARQYVAILDEAKLVDMNNFSGYVPVEVHPAAVALVESELVRLGAGEVIMRRASRGFHGPVVTEGGNLILDVRFGVVDAALEDAIQGIFGVVTSGVFAGYVTKMLVARRDGSVDELAFKRNR